MSTQPEALRLADEVAAMQPAYFTSEVAAELRRLHQHVLALQDWLDKTNWVQESAQAGELGMHRADVLRKRIEKLESVNQELLGALKSAAEYLHDKSGCLWLRSDFQRGCRCSEDCSSIAVWKQARAAIAKAEGEAK